MNKTAVVFSIVTVLVGVFYIASTFYTAYVFEPRFEPIASSGETAAAELRFWLGEDARAAEVQGHRFKRGMPPRPVFFYRFKGAPQVFEGLIARYDMQPEAIEATALESVFKRPGAPSWWVSPESGPVRYYRARTRDARLHLFHYPSSEQGYLYIVGE